MYRKNAALIVSTSRVMCCKEESMSIIAAPLFPATTPPVSRMTHPERLPRHCPNQVAPNRRPNRHPKRVCCRCFFVFGTEPTNVSLYLATVSLLRHSYDSALPLPKPTPTPEFAVAGVSRPVSELIDLSLSLCPLMCVARNVDPPLPKPRCSRTITQSPL